MKTLAVTLVTIAIAASMAVLSSGGDKVRQIPLSEIYATSNQKGLRPVIRRPEEPYGKDLNRIYSKTAGMGASNAFMVHGKDLAAAIRSTATVFLGGHAADVPAERDEQAEGTKYWMVAYLGSGSQSYDIRLVTLHENNIRIHYVRVPQEVSAVYQYFTWVPIQDLKSGIYYLELFDAQLNCVTMSRRVKVGK
jgi:hypothetical protein